MQKKAFLFSAGEYLPSRYLKIDDLSGVKHDVSAMEKRLMQIGFNVTKYENLSKKDYRDADNPAYVITYSYLILYEKTRQ